ncbi:hypothetical protein C8J56DRAFT_840580 [Mycena floridula]|nr:hypothetical protein C8J56DRAFT_840580 [Mycena floridula]
MATKFELYSINQSWPFSSEEQQSILSTLSRLKLSLLSLSDDSTCSADGDGMNDGHSLALAPGNDVIQQDSRPDRGLHMGMIGSYIGNARDVLSNNIINEADPAVGQGIDKLNDREDDKERAKQQEEFLQWISPLDFHSTQTATFGRHTVGTGTWLLQDSRFLDWLQGNTRLLWCCGDPGVGKTILASVIINHLQRLVATPEDVIIYIYCEYNQKVDQTSTMLLGSILKQLVERRSAISQHLLSLYKTHSSCKTMPTFSELMDAIRTELQSYTRAYLIVDALDECSDEARNLFLSKEAAAGLRSFTDNLQLLMTSCNMPSITHALKVQGDKSTIHIEAHVEDLQTYIRGCLVGVKRLNQLVKDNRSLQDNIIEVVISKAAGMFLQAKLHLNSLARQTNVKALRKALEGLPEDIWRSYDNAMLRIDAQGETDSKLAYHIFYWLSCSKRPLTVLELQHAVAVSLDSEMTDMEPEAIVDLETLTDVCAGLIISNEPFTSSQTTVRLVHYTMQKYLQSNQQRLFPEIQSLMAITCLTYMSFDVFSTTEWKHGHLVRPWSSTQYPLYNYAALFWGKHACDNQEEIFPHVHRFLQKPANVACALKVSQEYKYLGEDLHSQLSSYTLMMKSLLANNSLGPADAALLHSVSLLGHAETVMMLLPKVDINAQNSHSRTALSYSAEYGQLNIVQILLKLEDILPDLPDKDGRTPFIHACHHGHVEIVQLFLARHDVNHNLRDCNGWTALFHAVGQGHLDVAQILLQNGDIWPDIPENTGRTPLIWVAQQSPASWKCSELMELLLEREDVNPDSQDEHLRTALSYNAGGMSPGQFDKAARYRQALCLLEKGATADLPDKYLRTPLSYAIESRQSWIIELLLENPAVDRYSPNLYLHTPIWSPRAERLLKEYSEWKKNHLPGKPDTKFPPDSSQVVIAGSLDKVRDEAAWAWGFNTPQTQDQYTNNLDVLFLEIATPRDGGFHGSIHNPVYGAQAPGVVRITTLSTTTDTCLLSNLPLIGGRYKISPNKQGIYYEVRILEMEDAVGVGLACRPYPAWYQPGWGHLSAAWHLDDMAKFFEDEEGEEYLPDTKLQNGDIVGVGFIHKSGTVFFTLNGSRLPDAFTGIFLPHSKHDLFAAVGIIGEASIEINFGAEKFIWSEGNECAWSVEGVFDVLDDSEEGTGQSDEL